MTELGIDVILKGSVQKFHQGIPWNSLFPKFHEISEIEISEMKIVFHEISIRTYE